MRCQINNKCTNLKIPTRTIYGKFGENTYSNMTSPQHVTFATSKKATHVLHLLSCCTNQQMNKHVSQSYPHHSKHPHGKTNHTFLHTHKCRHHEQPNTEQRYPIKAPPMHMPPSKMPNYIGMPPNARPPFTLIQILKFTYCNNKFPKASTRPIYIYIYI